MRIFDYDSIFEMLGRFDLPGDEFKYAQIFKSEQLTPDSKAVAISCRDEKCYVLFAEDYIASLEGVKVQIEEWLPSKVMTFARPKEPVKFEDTVNSRFYTKPDHEKIRQWESYAVESGTYYVFLAQVDPDKENDQYYVASITGGNDRIRITKSPSENLPDELKDKLPLDSNESFLESWIKRRGGK